MHQAATLAGGEMLRALYMRCVAWVMAVHLIA
jgi:hypothetical protein